MGKCVHPLSGTRDLHAELSPLRMNCAEIKRSNSINRIIPGHRYALFTLADLSADSSDRQIGQTKTIGRHVGEHFMSDVFYVGRQNLCRSDLWVRFFARQIRQIGECEQCLKRSPALTNITRRLSTYCTLWLQRDLSDRKTHENLELATVCCSQLKWHISRSS